LSVEEIRRLVRGFTALGVTKVRLTGGEPTVRRDILSVVEAVATVPGIKTVAMTTNAHRLQDLVLPLRRAGVTALNVSMDSLQPDRFQAITGTGRFEQVRSGIEAAFEAGFESIKINAVLLRGTNDDELPGFMEWVRNRPASVRFIELMRTGKNGDYFEKRHLSAAEFQLKLATQGWRMIQRQPTDGPAVVYCHPDYRGTIGLIAPYSKDFCVTCNRLRVSSTGDLKLCLFGKGQEPLRDLLQTDAQVEALEERIRALVFNKPVSHRLHEGIYGTTWNLAGIGG
jgi:cyclic pyranopterin phosphate synthase